jgi:hypothetical protein
MSAGSSDEACPICRLRSRVQTEFGMWKICSCFRCGEFKITLDIADDLPLMGLKSPNVALLSYYCFRAQGGGQQPTINRPFVEAALKESLPTPAERLDNLILALGSHDPDGGSFIEVHPQCYQGRIGAVEPRGVSFIASEAIRLGLAGTATRERPEGHTWKEVGDTRSYMEGAFALRLTMEGWRRYAELVHSGGVGSTAFMAMQFGDADLNKLIENHVRPSITQTGFTLRRLDDRPKAGLIDDRLRVEIRACRFLLADLTHANAGSYWEAGFAEGLGKPVIYLCKRSVFNDSKHKPHFDTNHHLTITWEEETVAEDMANLKATVRFSIPEARQVDP